MMCLLCCIILFYFMLIFFNVYTITYDKNSLCFVFPQCGLPSLEECKDLAEEAQSQGEILQAVKYHLVSAEPEKALTVGIAFIKGVCVICRLLFV